MITNSYTQLNSQSQLTPDEIFTVETVRQHLSQFNRGGNLIAYRHAQGRAGSAGGVFVQLFGFGGNKSTEFRNKNGKFTDDGVSPYTLVKHIKAGIPIFQ